jgi:hypothetical protein
MGAQRSAGHAAQAGRLLRLQQVRDFNLTDPAVQAKMRERYGSNVPLDSPVISPVAMERSDRLVTVAER